MANWETINAQYIQEHGIEGRQRDLPDTGIPIQLVPGDIYEPNQFPRVTLADGVTARLAWGRGALLAVIEMAAHSVGPEHVVTGDTYIFGDGGSATIAIDGNDSALTDGDLVYLTEGTRVALRAGPSGFKALEINSPVRVDLLRAAGIDVPAGVDGSFPDLSDRPPSLDANRICPLADITVTPVGPPQAGGGPATLATASARIIWGRHMMLSFVMMAPHSHFPMHIHPEDQLMMCMNGELIEGLAHHFPSMRGDKRNVILQPGGMVHSAELADAGAECLDIFWPIRPDYLEHALKHQAHSGA